MVKKKSSKSKKTSPTKKILMGKAKEFFDEYKEKLLLLVITFLEEEARHIGKWIKDISRIKQKIRRAVWSMTLCLLGGIAIFLGISKYLAALYPSLSNGLSYMLVGVISIIIAMIIKHF